MLPNGVPAEPQQAEAEPAPKARRSRKAEVPASE
jgi:hypothetical protein